MEPGWVTQTGDLYERASWNTKDLTCVPFSTKANCHRTKPSCPKHTCCILYNLTKSFINSSKWQSPVTWLGTQIDGAEVAWVTSLTVFKYSHSFWNPSRLTGVIEKSILYLHMTLLICTLKDFVLIKSFPSHDKGGKGFHQSSGMIGLVFHVFFLGAFVAVRFS